jgi:multiple sugar transport system substrate-binding protein
MEARDRPLHGDLKALSGQVAGVPGLALDDYPKRALQMNRDAAYVYCAWLTSPEIVRKAALYGGGPCRVSSFQDPELVKKYPYYPAILDGMTSSIEYPPVKEAEDIHILVYDQVNAAVSSEKSAVQAAHDLQRSVLELMTKRGYYRQK